MSAEYTIELLQKHYCSIEFDTDEKDIIQIWQIGNHEYNLIQIERDKLKQFIEILQGQL